MQLLTEQDTYIALQPTLPQSSYCKMGERMVWQGSWDFMQSMWATTCSSAIPKKSARKEEGKLGKPF